MDAYTILGIKRPKDDKSNPISAPVQSLQNAVFNQQRPSQGIQIQQPNRIVSPQSMPFQGFQQTPQIQLPFLNQAKQNAIKIQQQQNQPKPPTPAKINQQPNWLQRGLKIVENELLPKRAKPGEGTPTTLYGPNLKGFAQENQNISQGIKAAGNAVQNSTKNIPVVKSVGKFLNENVAQGPATAFANMGYFEKTLKDPYHGTIPQQLGQFGTDALSLGQFAIPGGEAAAGRAAIEAGGKQLLKFTGKEAAKFGALTAGFGVAGELQKPGATVKSTLEAGAKSFVPGAALGVLGPFAGKAIHETVPYFRPVSDSTKNLINNQIVENYGKTLADRGEVRSTPAPQVGKTPEPTPTVVNPRTKNFVNSYVAEMDKQAAKAAKDSTPIVQKINQGIEFLQTKFVDSYAPIENRIRSAIKKGLVSPDNNIIYQIDRVKRANQLAASFMDEHGLARVIQSVNRRQYKELSQYLIAKRSIEVAGKGIKTGRNLNKDKMLVEALKDTYEPHAQEIKAYTERALDEAVNYGLISKEGAERLKKENPSYIPLNKVFADSELTGIPKNVKRGGLSVADQTVVKSLKGSERAVQDPFVSLIDNTNKMIEEGERNRAAQMITSYRDLPGNPFGLNVLRSAENVKTRWAAYKFLKETKPIRDQLEKQVIRTKKQIDELVRRNKALSPDIIKRLEKTAPDVRKGAIKIANNVSRAPEKSTKLAKQFTSADLREAFEQYMDGNPALVKRMYEFLGNKSQVARIEKDLSRLKNEFEGIKAARGAKFDEARLARDASAKGKSTISVMRGGIKEIYEVHNEIAEAAKHFNAEQMGLIGKILSPIGRTLQLGATGLNIPFAMVNILKDLGTGFINTANGRAMFDLEPISKAFAAALSHRGESYTELTRNAAGGTKFDIAREAKFQNVKSIRAERSVASKVLYNVTTPAHLMRALENTIGRSEEFNRALQYYSNKKAFLAKGENDLNAQILAADAARSNTVNFARSGDYIKVLNSIIPYLNAGIQGSRALLKNMRDRPVPTIAKYVVIGAMPTAITTVWNLSDPERKRAYDNISQYEKDNNFIIIPPNPKQDSTGRWNAIKIPVSQEIANLNNIIQNAFETAMKDKNFDAKGAFGNLMGTGTSLNLQSKNALVSQLTPQGVKAFQEWNNNTNTFTGNQIVPDEMKNLPAKDQYTKNTSATAKYLGNVFNISPLKLDDIIKTSTAGTGQTTLNATDQLLVKLGQAKQEDVRGKTIFSGIEQRFVGAQGSTPGQLFYRNIDAEAKKQNLVGSEYDRLKSILNKEMDSQGHQIPTDFQTMLDNNAIKTDPKILSVLTAAAKQLSQQTGQPLSPFYKLTPEQQRTVEIIATKKALDHNDLQASIMIENNKSWYKPYENDLSGYFQKLNLPASKGVKTPTPSPQVVQEINDTKLLSGHELQVYRTNHPELQDYYNQLDKFTRAQHDFWNEPQYKDFPTPSVRVNAILNALPQGDDPQSKAARSQIYKDLEVNNFLASVAEWELNNGAAKAQYEGQDYTQKDLKNIYNVGRYDIGITPTGGYALTAGNMANGTPAALTPEGSTAIVPRSSGGGKAYTRRAPRVYRPKRIKMIKLKVKRPPKVRKVRLAKQKTIKIK